VYSYDVYSYDGTFMRGTLMMFDGTLMSGTLMMFDDTSYEWYSDEGYSNEWYS
jgi:hypothetical protein